jgi:hemolysin III
LGEQAQGRGEEIANSVSHGVALLAAVAGVPFLFVHAHPPEIASLIGVTAFASCGWWRHATPRCYRQEPAYLENPVLNAGFSR